MKKPSKNSPLHAPWLGRDAQNYLPLRQLHPPKSPVRPSSLAFHPFPRPIYRVSTGFLMTQRRSLLLFECLKTLSR
jgi:hypothetical protein